MSYLARILERRSSAVRAEKAASDMRALFEAATARRNQRDFCKALRADPAAIIAEIKRASPSLGAFAAGGDAARCAASYYAGGAAAVSVLTEPYYFHGDSRDLDAAKSAAPLPVLCKDFVVDEFQVLKAAACGADATLLIAAALAADQLRSLLSLCASLQLAALVEVHAAHEVVQALGAGATLIGINNRDLNTFEVDLNTALRLRTSIPADVLVVAESGYRTAEQIYAALDAGVNAVLVGETLMRAADPQQTLADLRRECLRRFGASAWCR